MDSTFYNCINFESDLSAWDVSKVTNFISTFNNCYKFTSDLSKWDMTSAQNISGMFEGCKVFESDLSGWDLSNLDYRVNKNSIFKGCPKMYDNAKLRPKARRNKI